MKLRSLLALFLILISMVWARQQQSTVLDIEMATKTKDLQSARAHFSNVYQRYAAANMVDSFATLVPMLGAIVVADPKNPSLTDSIAYFIQRVRQIDSSASVVRPLYQAAAEFYANLGRNQFGYDAIAMALATTQAEPNADPSILAQLEYNLGVYAQRMGNVQVSENHHRKAMNMRQRFSTQDPEALYLSLNAMGAVMWFASKQDSATYYFNQAMRQLEKLPAIPQNKFYRRSIILNNLAGLYAEQGKHSEGIRAMEECIRISQQFVNDKEPHPKKESAEAGIYQGMDNLAGLFKNVGDYKKAGDLLHFSYNQKLSKLTAGHSDIFISEILLGQHYTDIREYSKAIQYLQKGLNNLAQSSGDYLYWEADACYVMARALSGIGKQEEAKEYYYKSEILLKESFNDVYDNIYLGFLRNSAIFWASQKDMPKAKQMAKTGYEYILKVLGKQSLEGFYQLLNFSEIHFMDKQFAESKKYAEDAITVVERYVQSATNRIDSVRMQMYLPQAIMLQQKSRYHLALQKDSATLSSIAEMLEKAIQILEQRKFLVDDPESVNVLMAENAALLEFAQQIELERYQLTGREIYLDQFINLHESTIYTRIRSRLDRSQAIAFANLPAAVAEEENSRKAAISSTLHGTDPKNVENYLQARAAWADFLEVLRIQYPRYYEMRYGSLTQGLRISSSQVKDGENIVRYYLVNDSLYALVLNKKYKTLIPLHSSNLENRLAGFYTKLGSDKYPSEELYSLYTEIWKPIEPFIQEGPLTIIPDGVLYTLSFDLLPLERISTYAGLATKGLMSRHAISYRYSLLQNTDSAQNVWNDNYIAFVPGFEEKEKEAYRKSLKDTLLWDQQYLRLLSQPNTLGLAKKLSKKLNGKAYTDAQSTLSKFRESATGHKIVHIGTHAEYDNIRPDRSRLIFSKQGNAADSNALYMEDIYACQIQSNLTILSACESGMPGYQDGEGMVSLAHAFNYAGSQNILMGLWKIDEKSSTVIIENMVNYLKQGISATEALRKSKIDYLLSANGRTVAPAYWAGLVIMGEGGVITLSDNDTTSWWFLGIALLAIFIWLLWWRSRQHRA